MKVKVINPGAVYNKGDGWFYNILWDGRVIEGSAEFSSASSAKQAMRERIALDRKRNGLGQEKKA